MTRSGQDDNGRRVATKTARGREDGERRSGIRVGGPPAILVLVAYPIAAVRDRSAGRAAPPGFARTS